ncbi:hypothetical protein O3M35_004214 [Rhynocoris fuscipes]|uniref:Gamma-secretase-activating protein C-terminal domain-containing protein n=1 Tax=Rhynocoris fuscipes TaxID=488301 RepID=A0AAW1CGJ6_9HEMI
MPLSFGLKSKEGIKAFFEVSSIKQDEIAKEFCWAQWDAVYQSLFYIHTRENLLREDEVCETPSLQKLSALQFNDNVPHETVLNIPLNLPVAPLLEASCRTYDDIAIPLKVHDCSIDVTVLTDQRGIVCICHHYIYQPVKDPVSKEIFNAEMKVHVAYSVTLLHHGTVIHCTVPGVRWSQASQIKPIFMLHQDDYVLVRLRGILTHLLDTCPNHQPYCHITLNDDQSNCDDLICVHSLSSCSSLIDFNSFKIYRLDISKDSLLDVYSHHETQLLNKLSILHYILVHCSDFDVIAKLLNNIGEKFLDPSVQEILHEILVGGSYASVYKSLSGDAIKLIRCLPFTTVKQITKQEIKSCGRLITMTQEALWNPSVMLLSPSQRLHQFRSDLWTQLWNLIAETSSTTPFQYTEVAEKLMVSLVCYQPEALSRCSTPLSPAAGCLAINSTITEMTSFSTSKLKPVLPFYEVEKCTASKQEHVISVNLRELSIHLVKHGLENPLQVHVVATRYAGAQLEMSRYLCSLLTSCAGIAVTSLKGFQLIDSLSGSKRRLLFALLQRYSLAIDRLAYPVPQGFPSFFTYLTYRSLNYERFIQCVQANALQLQIDVMRVILSDLGDTPIGIKKKLRLILLLPRSRAKRLLNQWSHPISLMLRAREHSLNILSGLETRTHPHRSVNHNLNGISSSNTSEWYSSLDSFLDLLTAKASLAELDFNLLVDATVTSL